MRTSVRLFLLTALTFTFSISSAQEYDDMYFNKNDRKKLKPVVQTVEPDEALPLDSEVQEVVSSSGNTSFLGKIYDYQPAEETLDSFEVSEEAIERYRRSSREDYTTNEVNVPTVEQNPNFSSPVETYQDPAVQGPAVVNNYYGDGAWSNRFNGGWGFGSRWNNWGWGPGFGFSVGWGNAFWDPFWDPFWNPFWDPFWGNGFGWGNGLGWGWGRPVGWGWGGGFRRGFWGGGFYDPWCPPGFYGVAGGFYGGVYRGPVAVRNERVGRAVVRGPRASRGGAQPSRRAGRVEGVANSVERRDFSGSQSRYLQRSRNSVEVVNGRAATGTTVRSRNAEAARNIRSSQARNRNSINTGSERSSEISRSRSGSSSSGRSESVNTRRSRSTSSPSRSNSSVRSRSSSSRSFSTPSRSSGSVRSSRPSRSFSTPSRSSGSVRSRSSAPSRSSGRSSGRSSSSRSGRN